MSISRLIVGLFFVAFGILFFFFAGFIDGPGVDAIGILTGLIFLVFGFVVLFNKEEDEIEARMDVSSKTKNLNKKKIKK